MLETQRNLIGSWHRHRFRNWGWNALFLALALVACYLMLAVVGDAYFVLVHAFYLPVLLAAFWLGILPAIAVGAVAGLLAGPWLPEHLHPMSYADGSWLYRLAFFVGIGGVAGWLADRIYLQNLGVRHLYARTLRGFVRVLEYKDEETSEHCERVAANAVLLGYRLGLTPRRREALYWAGYLHDIGKIATPAHILAKPAKLTDEEYEVVKRHTVLGDDLLAHVSPAFEAITQGVRHHHERWDGTGYPDGLAGEDIPLFGRILAVIDVFEALTSDRPYRAAMPEREAAALVREGIGTHFDPDVGHEFLRLMAQDRLHVEGRHGRHTDREAPDAFDPGDLHERRRPPFRRQTST